MIGQFLIVLLVSYFGEILSRSLGVKIPSTIMGMILLFVLLYLKILKVKNIEKASNKLLENMTILFLPPAVKLLGLFHMLQGEFLKIILLLILTTGITMIITGKTVEILIKIVEKKRQR